MKTKLYKTYALMASISLIAFLPTLSLGVGGASGARIVTQITVNTNGAILVLGDTPWDNPGGCTSSTRIYLLPEYNSVANVYYSEMYALLVASYLQGTRVSGFVDGCTVQAGGESYPVFQNVASY